jgi:membrane-associated protein
MKWPERFFERHGAKSIFIARFIALFPPVAANLLAGMGKMSWRIFLFYNITGSAAYTVTYILIGYFFGKQWKRLETWTGPMALCLILAGLAIIVLSVVFRHSLSRFFARRASKKHTAKTLSPTKIAN